MVKFKWKVFNLTRLDTSGRFPNIIYIQDNIFWFPACVPASKHLAPLKMSLLKGVQIGIGMLTEGPLCRESCTLCRIKNHMVIQNGYLLALILQPGVYNVHRLCPPRRLRHHGRKKEGDKTSLTELLPLKVYPFPLTFSTLWANSAGNKLIICFSFSYKTGFDILCKL